MESHIERPCTPLPNPYQECSRLRRIAAASLLAAHIAFAQTTPAPEPPPGKLTTIYGFTLFGATGSRPDGGLVLGSDGNFYGTTTVGGSPACGGCGTIFRVTPDGNLTTLYAFTGGVAGGATPRGSMTIDSQGNLYGTTAGSTSFNPTAFRITPAGVFSSFGVLPGNNPNGLVLARDGNLYGTTSNGGPGQYGTFFRITPDGVVTLLHAFGGSGADYAPSALIEGSDGAFYGASRMAIVRITTAGMITVVYKPEVNVNGPTNIWDGLNAPASGLVQAGDGNFYGAADDGVFTVSPGGVFKRLFRYAEKGLSGSSNTSVIHDNKTALILGGDGNLYGSNGEGTSSVYQVTTSGDFKLIYKFAGDGSEGSIPSVLTQGPDGLYGTTMTSGPTRPGGGTVFKVTLSGGGGGTTTPPPPPVVSTTLSNLVAFDPNTDSLRGILPLFNVQSGPAWNPDSAYKALAVQQPNAAGLAADGLTPLVLRVQVPQLDSKVTFSITDSTPDSTCSGQPVCDNGPELVGRLCAIDSPVCDPGGPSRLSGVSAQQVAGTRADKSDAIYMAFAALQAPLDFVRPSHKQLDEALTARIITVTATLDGTGKNQTFELKLARPPVVLLHGIWSNAATWDWAIQHDQRFTVYAEDYSTQFPNNNAAHFSANLDKPPEGIAQAVSLLRDKHIAATQADLVGHSMGGLLARLYAAGAHAPDLPPPVAYSRAENLQSGDIHKLITLDTPHLGSELANGLFFGDFAITPLGNLVNKWVGCVTCGAAADLQAGNEIVTNIPESKIPSHAIAGVGGETVLHQIDLYSLLVEDLLPGPAKGIAEVIRAGTEYDSIVFGGDHDLIVSETSQKGGLSGDAVSRFEARQSLLDCVVDKLAGLPLSDCWLAAHFTVTKENRISARVIDLLNAPANSPWFGRFPATSTLVAH